jgi:hypothetical protein
MGGLRLRPTYFFMTSTETILPLPSYFTGLYTFRPNGIWFVVGCVATGTWIIGNISEQHFTSGNRPTYAVVCVTVGPLRENVT